MKEKFRETINSLTGKELLFHLYATQLLLLVISAILGIMFFDQIDEFTHLFDWHDDSIITVGIVAALIVVTIDLMLMKHLPKSMYDDGGLNEKIFRGRTVKQIAGIAVMVAICEEVLFRGVIQTNVGLVISSIIFGLIHYRYLFNWFLFVNIMILSFLIGYIFLRTQNLSVTITMHFFIDFLLGLSIKFKKDEGEKVSE